MVRNQQSEDWSSMRVAAVLTGVIAALYLARETFIPLAFAITLALILSPAVGWLQRHRLRRVPAALLMLVVAIAASIGIGYVLINQLTLVAADVPMYRETIHKKILALRSSNEGSLGRAAQSVKEIQKELSAPAPQAAARSANPVPVRMIESPPSALAYLHDLVEPFLSPLTTLGIVLVFTVFLLVEQSDLRNRLFRLAGLQRLNLMTQALDDATRRVSRYLMLQFLVNAGFGIVCGAGLYWIGVPYAALWGAVAALLRIVPYVGAIAAGALPLLLSLAVFEGWMRPALVLALYAGLELTTANFLEPLLYGSHTGISSLALLLTTVFWATLWGPAGLILSTPLTVCVVVLGRHIPHLAFLHILLGDEPVMAPQAQLYQRLLAMDDQEARTLVDSYQSLNGTGELYDKVIMPTLIMAERDRHKGALDSEREEFLFLTIRDMIAECSGKGALPTDQTVAPAARVLCFPAHDEADEIAAAMLAQLVEQAGGAAITFPLGSSLTDLLGALQPADTDVLCVSSIPPFSLAHAKNVARQLHAKRPNCRILVGVWGFEGDSERALKRFETGLVENLVTTFAGALESLAPDHTAKRPNQPE